MKLQMFFYPDGTKNFIIKFSQLKWFIQPYFFLMIDHFFREGLPVYDMDSFEKPNEYDSDYETYPEMTTLVEVKDSLLCFAHDTDRLQKIVACRSNVEYEFKRETIKKIR